MVEPVRIVFTSLRQMNAPMINVNSPAHSNKHRTHGHSLDFDLGKLVRAPLCQNCSTVKLNAPVRARFPVRVRREYAYTERGGITTDLNLEFKMVTCGLMVSLIVVRPALTKASVTKSDMHQSKMRVVYSVQ